MSLGDFKTFNDRDFLYRTSKGKVVSAPSFPSPVPIADSHCHLNMIDDAPLALARSAHQGVSFVCCVLDPAAPFAKDPADEGVLSARETLEAAPSWLDEARQILDAWGDKEIELPTLRFAVGVHPHNAQYFDKASGILNELLSDERVTCLGEIGLDYHYDLSPRPTQREVFAEQLRLAQDIEMPVALHLREAHSDALEILDKTGPVPKGCILHCFNLDSEVLAPFLDLGCYVAFGGPLTFKKGYPTRQAALNVPLSHLLTETDAPFMAPEPLRGTVCTPDMTAFTLRTLLDCFGFSGFDCADALLQPRPSDIEKGAELFPIEGVDFDALKGGLSEEEFALRIFDNTVELLG